MADTPEIHISFEEWMDAGPYIPAHTDNEASHMSWKCGGGPHVQEPTNPHHTNKPRSMPVVDDQPDSIVKIIPGSLSSFREPIERYRQDTPDAVWESFRKTTRAIHASRELYDKPAIKESPSPEGVKVILSGLLNDIDK